MKIKSVRGPGESRSGAVIEVPHHETAKEFEVVSVKNKFTTLLRARWYGKIDCKMRLLTIG